MVIKQAYNTLRKKYKELPDFDKLNNEFEISTIEKEDFLLRDIKRKISEKIQQLQELLEKIINPELKSFADVYECRCFTNTEKQQVLEIYKQLLFLDRSIKEADLIQDEKTDVKAIKTALKEWPEFRQKARKLVEKLKECWKKPDRAREALEYLG